MMKRILFICCVILAVSSSDAVAQDLHFSQISQVPMLINPANTGNYIGEQRLHLNYRNQWASISNGFKTFAISGESRVLQDQISFGKLYAGGYVYSDRAGSTKLTINSLILSTALEYPLSKRMSLSAGINGGASQRSISPDDLQWDNQYNEVSGYNPDVQSNEVINTGSFVTGDFSGGINFKFDRMSRTKRSKDKDSDGKKSKSRVSKNKVLFNFGVSAYHINKPKLSYNDLANERYYRKFTFSTNYYFQKHRSKFGFIPQAVFTKKNTSNELLVGGRVRYIMVQGSRRSKTDKAAVSFGTIYRWKDAMIYTFLLEYTNYAFGISYDYNNSGLKAATNGKGGVEISLRMITPYPMSLGSKSKFVDF